MKAVVCGFIGTFPLGGVAWDYGQYVLALEELGYDVFYLEDSGQPVGSRTGDVASAVRFLERSLASLSPRLAGRWHYRSCEDETFGMTRAALADVLRTADLFLNVSGACLLRDEYADTANTIYVDTDPGYNHYDRFPAVDAWTAQHPDAPLRTYRDHDHHFTYAANLGRPGCPLPDMGLRWHPTRPPVSTRCWSPAPPGTTWTTVMSWSNYGAGVRHEGRIYGAKEMEFQRIEALPSQVSAPLEVAVSPATAPVSRWLELGWRHADAAVVSRSTHTYRAYVAGSRGELSVAKNVYVATSSGWMSCRSTCYLASGRPVVVQDTGLRDHLPTGAGLLVFTDLEEARAALAAVEEHYEEHAEAARALAEEHFEGERVLEQMLTDAGIGA